MRGLNLKKYRLSKAGSLSIDKQKKLCLYQNIRREEYAKSQSEYMDKRVIR